MLNQQTIEKLHAMKLHGMADAFHTQLETTDAGQLSFEERFGLLFFRSNSLNHSPGGQALPVQAIRQKCGRQQKRIAA